MKQKWKARVAAAALFAIPLVIVGGMSVIAEYQVRSLTTHMDVELGPAEMSQREIAAAARPYVLNAAPGLVSRQDDPEVLFDSGRDDAIRWNEQSEVPSSTIHYRWPYDPAIEASRRVDVFAGVERREDRVHLVRVTRGK